MSDMTTLARPYAKAIFEHALSVKELSLWSIVLQEAAQTALEPDAKEFIQNPICSTSSQRDLMLAIYADKRYDKERKAIENFIELLAENKRLLLFPDVYNQYEALRAEQEKTLVVDVISFTELTNDQQQYLAKSLSHRLQRQISLDVKIDKSLLGGAVVRAGDLVIDGSVRGKLNKLGAELAA